MLAIPTAHSLSHVIGVADCGYPSSDRVSRWDVASCALMNSAVYSAAAAESTTVVMMVDKYATGTTRVLHVYDGTLFYYVFSCFMTWDHGSEVVGRR